MDSMSEESRDCDTPPRLLNNLNPVPGSFKPRNRLLTMRPKRNSLLCVKKLSDSSIVQPLKAIETAVCISERLMVPPAPIDSNANTNKCTQPIRRFIKRVSVHFSQTQWERHRDEPEPEPLPAKRPSTRFSFNSWRRRRSLAHDRSALSASRDRSPLKALIAKEEQLTLYQSSDLSTDESISHASVRSDTSSPPVVPLCEARDMEHFKRSKERRSLWNFSQFTPMIGSNTKGTVILDAGSDHSGQHSPSLCPQSSIEKLFALPDPNQTPRPAVTPYPHKRKCSTRPSITYVQRKRRSTLRPNGVRKYGSEDLGSTSDSTHSQLVPSSPNTEQTLRVNQSLPPSLPISDVSRSTSPAPSVLTGPRSPIIHQIPVRRDVRGRRMTAPNSFLASSPSAHCNRCSSHSSLDLNTSSTWTLDKPQGQDSGLSSEVSTSSAQTAESTDFTNEVDVEEEEVEHTNPQPSPPAAHRYAIGRGSCHVESTTAVWSNRLRQSLDRAGRKCRLLAGRTLFNRNPKEGMQYLLEHGLVPRVPVAIARFLLNETELCRQAIGEYFGTLTDNLASDVLREYLQLLDLTGLELDEALRVVLSHFHPVGESQKISHLMQIFQETYIAQNPKLVAEQFRSSETIEILAYSVLLLHTDLHNPNVRRLGKRMTKQEFVTNNRGIDAGQDLPVDMLQAIYDRVAAAQFKTIPDPFDRLRGLDPMLTGPLKTDNFLQRHRRFVGWVAAQQLDNLVSRRSPKRPHGRWRHLLIFNDILIVSKPVTTGSLLNLTAAVAMGESIPVRNVATPQPHYLNTDRIVQHRLRPQPHSKSLDTTGKAFYSTEPMTTGNYHIRLVLPLVDLRVLVFESQFHQFGVQLCNNAGPIINLNLVSTAARQTLIDWLHGSITEMSELRRYHQSKTEPKISPTEPKITESDDSDLHAVEFQTRL